MAIKYIEKAEVPFLMNGLSDEFALIENPGYIFPKFEVVPLAKKLKSITDLEAVVMDMDGTTTTTEVLCIHSLEYMIRQITGRMSKEVWEGLDEHNDYPHIIGNSTTKHVEYLIKTYRDDIVIDDLKRAFIKAAVRTLCFGKDPNRIAEVKNNLASLGLNRLQFAAELELVIDSGSYNFEQCPALNTLIAKNFNEFRIETETEVVRAAIDIYYARYHEILALILEGKAEKVIEDLDLPKGRHLIEPMPGALLMLLLLKGKLKGKIPQLKDFILSHIRFIHADTTDIDLELGFLQHLAVKFEQHPVRIAVVTSSIKYEADIVLSQVFKVFREELQNTGLKGSELEELTNLFSDHNTFYDAVLTATDSSEIRLKPFRDLYSMALHKLAVPVDHFDRVIGFEDSESGNLAIRAAGIGLAVAVPFAQTAGHNLSSASYVAKYGLPEVIFKKHLFFNQ